jgi:hypothetical protein
MNRAAIITVVVAVLLLVGGGYFFFKLITPTAPDTAGGTDSSGLSDVPYVPYQTQTPGSAGSGSSDGSGTTVTLRTGEAVQVNAFKNSRETKEDPSNPGHYYLTGADTLSASYTILFTEGDQSFNITLLQEPIGTTRAQAEQKLLQILGISQADACYLRYRVGVPYGINPVYAGNNLGFSFCPGATQL